MRKRSLLSGHRDAARKGGRALVIGGSIAGLLAARVLTEHFDEVIIIERDHLSEDPTPRKGVPQARHLHVLLAEGRIIIEKLFPGIREELIERGAHILDMANDTAWLTPAGWGIRFPSDLLVLGCSRDLLEWTLRRRVASLPRVRFIEGRDVMGLSTSEGGGVVTGVRLALPGGGSEAAIGQQCPADLVVDASGRGSRAPLWLKALGYEKPRETVVNASLVYASRIYRIDQKGEQPWKGIYVQAAPPEHTRGGVFFPIEGDRWLLTLVGLGGDCPPTDEEGFFEFARSLRTPLIADTIRDAEPLTPVASYKATENRLRHYEKLARLPEGLLVLGDAACAFNPVYGQGMTAAALSALALDGCLRKQNRGAGLNGLARRFQKQLAKTTTAAWMLATSEDFRVRGVVGGKPNLMTSLMQGYVDRVVELSTESIEARRVLLEVFNLMKPPAALFNKGIAINVLKRVFREPVKEAGLLRLRTQSKSEPSVGSVSALRKAVK